MGTSPRGWRASSRGEPEAKAGIDALEGRQLLTATFQDFPLDQVNHEVSGIFSGPEGMLWVEEFPNTAYLQLTGPKPLASFAEMSPVSGTMTEYPLPTNVGPRTTAVAPDKSLWFTAYSNFGTSAVFDGIDRIAPDGTLSTIPLSQPIVGPSGMTFGPDGNLWLVAGKVDLADNPPAGQTSAPVTIDRVTADGTVTVFPIGVDADGPIVTGPDNNFWFPISTSTGEAIGRMTPSGSVSTIPLPAADEGNVNIRDMANGPDGNIWFTENAIKFGDVPRIGRITPSGTITEFSVPPDAFLGSIASGTDGNLWFTEETFADDQTGPTNKVARITTGGTITEYPTPTSKGSPGPIVQGPDGNLWFGELGSGMIGRVAYSPPALVTGIRRYNPHLSPSGIVLAFSADLDPTSAQNVANYTLVSAGTKGTAAGPTIAIEQAIYNTKARTVTLIVDGTLKGRGQYRLTVNGSTPTGVANTDGVLISGDGSGSPGHDYVTPVPSPSRMPRIH